MHVIYTDRARQDGEAYNVLHQATEELEETLGLSATGVKAEWDPTDDDKGRSLYTLRIADQTDSATASFTLDELKSPKHLKYRFYRLWGDLLQARNHKQLQALQRMGNPER